MHDVPGAVDHRRLHGRRDVWLYKRRAGRDIRPWAQKTDTDSARTREVLRGVGLGHLRTNELAASSAPAAPDAVAQPAAVTEHKIMILDETTASTSEETLQRHPGPGGQGEAAGTHIMCVSHPAQRGVEMPTGRGAGCNALLIDVVTKSDWSDQKTFADDITTLMIGRALKALERPAPPQSGEQAQPVMSVRDLRGGSAHGVSFDVMPGEVVGLYGLVGSGRSSVARSITGQKKAVAGTITVNGEEVQLASPGARLKKDRLPDEDRRLEGSSGLRTTGEHEPGRAAHDAVPRRRDRLVRSANAGPRSW